MDWNNWNIGRKTIFVSVCIAGLALCLRFIDNGPLSQTGFTRGFWKGHLVFMGIPLALVLTKSRINLYAGIFCGLLITVAMCGFISIECAVTVGERTGNIAGFGAYLYGLMGAALALGVWLDHKSPNA